MLKPFEWRGWEVTLVKHKTNVMSSAQSGQSKWRKKPIRTQRKHVPSAKPGKTRVIQVTVGFVFAADWLKIGALALIGHSNNANPFCIRCNAQLIRFMKIYSQRNKLPASKVFPLKC